MPVTTWRPILQPSVLEEHYLSWAFSPTWSCCWGSLTWKLDLGKECQQWGGKWVEGRPRPVLLSIMITTFSLFFLKYWPTWKEVIVTPPRKSGCGRGTGVLIFLLKDFFSKFLILPTGLPRRRSPPKIAARWRYGPPIKDLRAHYNSQFFVIFSFCIDQEDHRGL